MDFLGQRIRTRPQLGPLGSDRTTRFDLTSLRLEAAAGPGLILVGLGDRRRAGEFGYRSERLGDRPGAELAFDFGLELLPRNSVELAAVRDALRIG
jgi:hypothetical protein